LDKYWQVGFVRQFARAAVRSKKQRRAKAPEPHPEEPRSGVSKDEATGRARWFETAPRRLLTMRTYTG
jgi:hypothetical protein